MKYLQKFFFLSLFFAACFLINACSTGKYGSMSQANVPDKIIEESNKFIISKTGEEFFDKNISFNENKTVKLDNGYKMVYDFMIPGKEYVNEEISFMIDSLGNILKEEGIKGIPDCINNNCDFSIDESDAKQIALKNNFEKGIKDWKTDFVWNEEHGKYAWAIQSTTFEDEGAQGYRGGGEVIFIDASTGEVLGTKGWRVN
jgi:hypothetical protein